MIDKKTFKKAIAIPLESAGFRKKGQSWYLDGTDNMVVINLQKSDYSDMYYLNLGIWLKAFGEAAYPQYYHCHLYYRVERFFPEQRELILLSCSLDKSNPRMISEFSEFITHQLIPFLIILMDENNLRDMMSRGELNQGLVLKAARDYLSGSG